MKKLLTTLLTSLLLITCMTVNVVADNDGTPTTSTLEFNNADLDKTDIYYKLGNENEVQVNSDNRVISNISNGTTVVIRVSPKEGNEIGNVYAKEGENCSKVYGVEYNS